jgi:hypothetical protein
MEVEFVNLETAKALGLSMPPSPVSRGCRLLAGLSPLPSVN